MLEKEFEYFKKNEQKFIKDNLDKYVVIKGEDVLGFYEDESTALIETLKKHEMGTFLVQLISNDTPRAMFRSRVVYAK